MNDPRATVRVPDVCVFSACLIPKVPAVLVVIVPEIFTRVLPVMVAADEAPVSVVTVFIVLNVGVESMIVTVARKSTGAEMVPAPKSI